MKKGKTVIIQLFSCLLAVGACCFSYLEKQNELTKLRLYAPKLLKDVQNIREENTRLRYRIQQLDNPENLIRLAQEEKFSRLKHPPVKDILVLESSPSGNIDRNEQTLAARGL